MSATSCAGSYVYHRPGPSRHRSSSRATTTRGPLPQRDFTTEKSFQRAVTVKSGESKHEDAFASLALGLSSSKMLINIRRRRCERSRAGRPANESRKELESVIKCAAQANSLAGGLSVRHTLSCSTQRSFTRASKSKLKHYKNTYRGHITLSMTLESK